MKVDLLIIDPQVDFCKRAKPVNADPSWPQDVQDSVKADAKGGALFVDGADKDCERMAAMIRRIGPRLNDIHVTLDTHHWFDIAHPSFWMDAQGNPPPFFTTITVDDVKSMRWRTAVPHYYSRKTMEAHFKDDPSKVRDGALEYVKALADNKRYELTIWPPHCLIGSDGAKVMPDVWAALSEWERANGTAFVDYVTKGSNYWTEHYSAFQADVVDPSDPTTAPNMKLGDTLKKVDLIGVFGEALSHCLAHTATDIANYFGEENIKKLVLIQDCASNVTGCDALGADFVKKLSARGMQLATSTDFLS